ncbi:hypothetical protein L7F22_022057 [Adiantum nelumboides]|nr:hypothetical protein [Adiantum nelumboides]
MERPPMAEPNTPRKTTWMTVAVGTPSARYSRRTSSDKKALEDMIMAVRRDMEAEIQQAAAAMCSQLDDLRKENQQLRDDLRRTKEEMGLLQAHVREIREDGELPQVAAIAKMCIQPEPDYRPFMTDVVQSLVPLVKQRGSSLEVSYRSPNVHPTPNLKAR